MKKICISCYVIPKFINKGSCFENMLLLELEDVLKDPYIKNYNKIKILLEKIHEQKDINHPQDILHYLFTENVTMDFIFSNELKLYDVITPNCMIAKNEVGQSFIDLLNYSEIVFILKYREFTNMNTLDLDFSVCNTDYRYDVHNLLIKGGLHA